jgi:hypothetical protein
MVGEPAGHPGPFEVLRQRAHDLDPMAFPIDIPAPVMRERQRECGVDLDWLDRGFESLGEITKDIDAILASLGL